jgi:hypothetical protein
MSNNRSLVYSRESNVTKNEIQQLQGEKYFSFIFFVLFSMYLNFLIHTYAIPTWIFVYCFVTWIFMFLYTTEIFWKNSKRINELKKLK